MNDVSPSEFVCPFIPVVVSISFTGEVLIFRDCMSVGRDRFTDLSICTGRLRYPSDDLRQSDDEDDQEPYDEYGQHVYLLVPSLTPSTRPVIEAISEGMMILVA